MGVSEVVKNQLFNILEELFQQANEKIIVFNRLGEIEFVNKRASEALQLSNIDSHFFKLTEKSSTEWKEFINSVVQNITASYTLSVVNDNNQEVTLKILGYYIEEKQLIFGRVRLNPINTFSIAGNKNAKTFQQLINGMAHGVVLTSMDGKNICKNKNVGLSQ